MAGEEMHPAPRRRFEGKVVLVVGAGRPVDGWSNGAAAAAAYAAEGALVACLDHEATAADRIAELIEEAGGRALPLVASATDMGQMEAAVTRTLGLAGRIDVLHNNVGATVMGGPVEIGEPEFLRAVELNLGSVWRSCKLVIPHMVARGGGAIVNISSLAAIRWTGYEYFAYSAAKAAVNQATVAVALQYARQGIRANCILPGAIDTPLIYREIAGSYGSVEEMRAARGAMVPCGFTGKPEDVAAAALFLASDEARFITGVCLPVDGGQSASATGAAPQQRPAAPPVAAAVAS